MYQCAEIQLRGKVINNFIETDINAYTIRYLLIFYTLTISIMLSILSGHISSSVQEDLFCKEHVYSVHKNPFTRLCASRVQYISRRHIFKI